MSNQQLMQQMEIQKQGILKTENKFNRNCYSKSFASLSQGNKNNNQSDIEIIQKDIKMKQDVGKATPNVFKGVQQNLVKNQNKNIQQRNSDICSEENNGKVDFKKMGLQNLDSNFKKIHHLKQISNDNPLFIKRNKKASSIDISSRNKQYQIDQKLKNLKGIDTNMTDIRERQHQYMEAIFSDVRKAEEEAKSKSKKPLARITQAIKTFVNTEVRRNYAEEIQNVQETDGNKYKNDKDQSEKLWRRSSIGGGHTNEEISQLVNDHLKEMNKNILAKEFNIKHQDYNTDFSENFNWSFKENKF